MHARPYPFLQALCVLFSIALLRPVVSPAAPTDKPQMAVVVSTLSNPWFVVLADNAKARATELGYDVTVYDSHDDLAQESAAFDRIIASGGKAILLNATDSNQSAGNVARARKAGVAVVCMDRVISSSDAVSQILSDNYSGCVVLGEYFVERMGDHARYIELLGQPSDTNTWMRSKGFHSVVDKHPEMKMVAQQGAEFSRSKASEVLTALLHEHPDVDAVFCGNDAMALGAHDAIAAAQKTDRIKVFGFDGDEAVVQAVEEGKIAATVMQFPVRIARTAAEYADKYLKGDQGVPRRVPVPVELITPANARRYLEHGAK